MNVYRHEVSGVFAQRAEAERARQRMIDAGIPSARLRILGAGDAPAETRTSRVKRSLGEMLTSGAIGLCLGLLVTTLTAFALSKDHSGPLFGVPLSMLGWGSLLGAVFGAMVGASAHVGQIAQSFRYAIGHGEAVLLVETHADRETQLARDIIEASAGVGVRMDVSLS
ncbi:hypothetical protein [Pseudomonas panipatensis]|uniref:DUF1269 domain-containing protein n=1 Tax=Pseudomonas panipatensis TaxID=428992 RepID=A0A1G8KYG6_9PSED|nr:hypothetical protein [Pseudomonas panipatensis]SDI48575.1 hypothetical protein SAMN05216272_11040 [Pseudomonas panipatensis]SMP72997.1 hypothetical protein SAMN06295951_111130 [Pseudomonas panipatensis]